MQEQHKRCRHKQRAECALDETHWIASRQKQGAAKVLFLLTQIGFRLFNRCNKFGAKGFSGQYDPHCEHREHSETQFRPSSSTL